MLHVFGDASPQQLHGRPITVALVDARAAQLQNFAWGREEPVDRILIGRIESPATLSGFPAQQPVGGHNRARTKRAVDDQEMIAELIEVIEIPLDSRHLWGRLGGHFLIEDVISQSLSRLNLLRRLRQPDFHLTGIDVNRRALLVSR